MRVKDNLLLQQIFSIPLDKEKYLIYAPLKETAFICNRALLNSIFDRCSRPLLSISEDKVVKTDTFFLLHKLGFFQPEPFPKDQYLHQGIQYDAVILFLTNQCNLRCSYCYASAGEYKAAQMPWEIAKAGIDWVMSEVIQNRLPTITLGFHGGGEPTLNWDILTRATDYAQSLAEEGKIPLQVTGSFNGYWSKKVLHYVLRNFTELSLSFDGMPAVQNLQRPTADNKGSFRRVRETLLALDEAKFPYGIRMTVTNDSVDCLAENISFVCDNFRPQKIQVEPVFVEGRARRNRSAIINLDIFISQFIKAFRIAQKHHVILFYSGARLEALTPRFCMAACRALVITPEGDITTCFEIYGREHLLSSRFIIGNYLGEGRFTLDKKKLRRHFRHTVERIPHCKACFCKWHCAGDCAIKTISGKTGDRFQPTGRCRLNQELTKFLILDKIMESGGLIWTKRKEA